MESKYQDLVILSTLNKLFIHKEDINFSQNPQAHTLIYPYRNDISFMVEIIHFLPNIRIYYASSNKLHVFCLSNRPFNILIFDISIFLIAFLYAQIHYCHS